MQMQAVADIHDRPGGKVDFPRDGGHIVLILQRHIANQQQHAPPFLAMRAALPLVAQVVFILLHARDRHHAGLEQGQTRPQQRDTGHKDRLPRQVPHRFRLHHCPATRPHDIAPRTLRPQIWRDDVQAGDVNAPPHMRARPIRKARRKIIFRGRLLKQQKAFPCGRKQGLADGRIGAGAT